MPGETDSNTRGVALESVLMVLCDYVKWVTRDIVLKGRGGCWHNAIWPSAAPRRRLGGNVGDDAQVLKPTGVVFRDVPHDGNSQSSREEGEDIKAAYAYLMRQRFVDRAGKIRPMTKDDVLVVTPYNAQANLLGGVLPHGARVGTIDKFQGQEAPVSLISMATSSSEELPRNIAFLFSVNRLNVAISRAQALAVVFASPRLLDTPCRSVDDLRLVNTVCAVKEYASRCLSRKIDPFTK
jgi:AAA domain